MAPKSRVVFWLPVLLVQSLCVAQSSFPADQLESIKAFLDANFEGVNAGMAIGLVDAHGTHVLSAGKLDNDGDQKVDGDTVFEIGSCTKTFTALLALDLAARGEWKMEDPVAKYLPKSVKVPDYDGKEIAILNLAAQDSGLPFNADNLSGMDWKERFDSYTAEKMYAFLSGYKLTEKPGMKFQYSNLGMSLLGNLIELRSGSNYESLVVTRICEPLHMDSTRITLTPELKARAAAGHDVNGKRAAYYDLTVMQGAGALRSTANDLLKFISANLGLTRCELSASMERMQIIRHQESPEFGQTAMPWTDFGVFQPPGMELLGHGGGTDGCSAFIGFDKRQLRGVVVLSNQKVVVSGTYAIGWRILQRAPLQGLRLAAVKPVHEYVGSGIVFDLDKETGAVRIGDIFPGSPAAQAGLSVGLIIQSIDSVSTSGKSLTDCAAISRGGVGTKVRLELVAPAGKKTNVVELTKQKFLSR